MSKPKLCLGTWQLESSFNKLNEEEILRFLNQINDINIIEYYDTALVYGNGFVEKMISKANSNIKKKIITKIPAIIKPKVDCKDDILSYYTEEQIHNDLNKSIVNLKIPPEIILLHNWSHEFSKQENAIKILKYLRILSNKYNIKYIGISLPNQFTKGLSPKILDLIDFIEVPYNSNSVWIEKNFEIVKKHNVRVAIRSIFNGGKDSSNYRDKIKKASLYGDILIIGMTKKINLYKNIKAFKELFYSE